MIRTQNGLIIIHPFENESTNQAMFVIYVPKRLEAYKIDEPNILVVMADLSTSNLLNRLKIICYFGIFVSTNTLKNIQEGKLNLNILRKSVL